MKLIRIIWFAILALFPLTGTAIGQTISVTISSDDIDIDWTIATIDDLPGPDG